MSVTRKTNSDILEALLQAQKIAFGPFIFQAVAAAKQLGIFSAVADSPQGLGIEQIAQQCQLTPYAVKVVVQVLQCADVLLCQKGQFTLTKVGECLIYNAMTDANFDFTGDVCYRGLDHLVQSLQTGRPAGLQELGNWPTIYPALGQLPEPARSSWFKFDHFHSDQAFGECVRWIDGNIRPERFLDVGGNTGKFAQLCLEKMPYTAAVIVDLPEQCALVQNNPKLQAFGDRLSTASVNWLNPDDLPVVGGTVDFIWMSQFLDCFSPQQAQSILQRCMTLLAPGGRIAILECLWDEQRHPAAALSLVCTSMYFTAMANGNSRFFSGQELRDIIAQSGLVIEQEKQNFGISHTLLVCTRAP